MRICSTRCAATHAWRARARRVHARAQARERGQRSLSLPPPRAQAEYQKDRLKFSKQYELFTLTMQKDREACTVAILDDIDGSNVQAIAQCVHENANAAGVSPSYLGLMHEVLLFPTDPTLGQESWDLLVSVAKACARGLALSHAGR